MNYGSPYLPNLVSIFYSIVIQKRIYLLLIIVLLEKDRSCRHQDCLIRYEIGYLFLIVRMKFTAWRAGVLKKADPSFLCTCTSARSTLFQETARSAILYNKRYLVNVTCVINKICYSLKIYKIY